MFAEKRPAVDHNDLLLNKMEGQTISINAGVDTGRFGRRYTNFGDI